ncbi:hypothetical protein P8935_10155 [Telmatobacter sp. DSM 110680]|uniref:Uncharacterized protein n=1 Tax=Telmatobacter sp. DSM 110680 TaxID=3036704 RepID=A0AAU7DPV5_9BACT
MTAAPIHWPGDVVSVDGWHMRVAVAGNALGRDLGKPGALFRSFTKTGLLARELAAKRLVSLGNTRQATAGWRAAAANCWNPRRKLRF